MVGAWTLRQSRGSISLRLVRKYIFLDTSISNARRTFPRLAWRASGSMTRTRHAITTPGTYSATRSEDERRQRDPIPLGPDWYHVRSTLAQCLCAAADGPGNGFRRVCFDHWLRWRARNAPTDKDALSRPVRSIRIRIGRKLLPYSPLGDWRDVATGVRERSASGRDTTRFEGDARRDDPYGLLVARRQRYCLLYTSDA